MKYPNGLPGLGFRVVGMSLQKKHRLRHGAIHGMLLIKGTLEYLAKANVKVKPAQVKESTDLVSRVLSTLIRVTSRHNYRPYLEPYLLCPLMRL